MFGKHAAVVHAESGRQINPEALADFKDIYGGSDKYKNSPIDWGRQYNGPTVAQSGMFDPAYGYSSMAASAWVADGGFTADEPNFFAALRHFFDPLAINGQNYLTDMPASYQGYGGDQALNPIINPEIDARQWALNHEQNAFSFKKGLEYYKKSMEVMVGLTDGDGRRNHTGSGRAGRTCSRACPDITRT